MIDALKPRLANITLSKLRPTQMTVGLLQVKHKREGLQNLEGRPGELVEFILENPIRVVLGPVGRAYVIDHHHLALALIKEKFETAPMQIEEDYSKLAARNFWKRMQRKKFVHPVDAEGDRKPLSALPKTIKRLQDDPYRSLAGFVRAAGGFRKVATPFAEFKWADYYRTRIKEKILRKDFPKAIKLAIAISSKPQAAKLPGFVDRQPK